MITQNAPQGKRDPRAGKVPEREEWQEDFESKFLKIEEGVHTVTILGPPERVVSTLTGRDQWAFPAEVDGTEGILAPSKRLGRLISERWESEGRIYPYTFQLTRKGMDLKSEFAIIEG